MPARVASSSRRSPGVRRSPAPTVRPGDVRVQEVPDPVVKNPADATVRVLRAAVCGSDLHPYRSAPATEQGRRMGHEFLGVVEDTGTEVTGLKRGDLVLSPFTYADNTCWWCERGLQTSCPHGGRYGFDGVDGGAVGLCAVLAAKRLGAEQVRNLTAGHGADAVLECVGSMRALTTSFHAVRDGGVISRVGVPSYTDGPIGMDMIMRNITLTGGVDPARH